MTKIFQLSDDLPKGLAIIDASAGTGKTYTLASLVVRYICESDLNIDQLLVVTFTKAAAAELRDRIRTRLIEALDILDNNESPQTLQESGELQDDTDALSGLLLSLPSNPAKRQIKNALANFDAATITTIHGFAQQALAAMGSSIAINSGNDLVGTDIELVEQACTDAMIRRALIAPDTTGEMPTCTKLVDAVSIVLSNVGIDLLPAVNDIDNPPSAQVFRALVDDALALITERRRRQGITTYDDLLTNLAAVLDSHDQAAVQLRQRYRVALIDEFQDTDTLQWRIFLKIFGDDGTLVLVADPKQAIYSFRGANVYSYLEAATSASKSSLGTNFRSDEAVLATTNALFDGATFGDPLIYFSPVAPCPEALGRRLRDPNGTSLPALHVRTLLGPHLERKDPYTFVANSGEIREYVASDLAHHVKDMLSSTVLPQVGSSPARPLQASDIAVLVRSHADGAAQYRALRRLGIPAVSSKTGSVLRSVAFDHWRYLLRSLEQPSNPLRARTAAKSWFFGWPDNKIVANRTEDFGPLHDDLHHWADLLRQKGVDAFCTEVFEQSEVRMHALDTAEGDRNFTDLEHIAEILRSLVPEGCASAAVLCSRLEGLVNEKDTEELLDVTERRVESAENAVQIMTVYAAKGLQFPVVCVPEMYRAPRPQEVPYQHPETGRRTFDLVKNADFNTKELMAAETLGEQLRLVYVALTRAQHQTILWWSRAPQQGSNALSHLLFARKDGVLDPDELTKTTITIPDDDSIGNQIEQIFSAVGDAFRLTEVDHPDHMTYSTGPQVLRRTANAAPDELEVASFDRTVDRSYGRWSFTAITSSTYREQFALFDDTLGDTGAHDELGQPRTIDDEDAQVAQLSDLPLGPLSGGTAFGTLVHKVLERTDFASPLLQEEVALRVRSALESSSWPVNEEELVDGLLATITTPLGPLMNGAALCDIPRSDRLDELNFEIHLGPNCSTLNVGDIGRLTRDRLGNHDPLMAWATRLANDEINIDLHGHLTGSIDLVTRVTSLEHKEPRYVIADYKTNRLSRYRQPPLARDYECDQLPIAMIEHHYPLQALLYGVALHRYLRWRQPNYQPEVHLGGAVYLFIRGMAGPTTPVHEGNPNGVFSWPFPRGLIADLSDLLATGRSPHP